MASRYWVGGTGAWTETAHWSASSGGAGGASVPGATDDVFFDAFSFTAPGQTVTTVDSESVCRDMDWTGATNTPTFAMQGLEIYGSVKFIAAMILTGNAIFNIYFLGINKTITMAGQTFKSSLAFLNNSSYLLSDNLICTESVLIKNYGILNLNGYNLTCPNILFWGPCTFTQGAGMVTLTGTNAIWDFLSSADVVITSSTGTIKILNNTATAVVFAGGGKTYNALQITGAGNYQTTITGSNTFNSITIDTPPKTVKFTDGTTQTVAAFVANGTSGNLITLTGTSTAGWAIVKSNTTQVLCKYLSLSYSTATPSNTWYAARSTDGGNNSGWNLVTLACISATLATCLKTITALKQVYSFDALPENINDFPCGLLLLSDINYLADFPHGSPSVADQTIKVRLVIIVGRQDQPTSLRTLVQFLDNRHASSIPAAIIADNTLSGMVDDAKCGRSSGMGEFSWGGQSYISTEFEIEILA